MTTKTNRTKSTFKPWRDLKEKTLSPAARARVDARVKRELLELDLKELRDMAGTPQADVAKVLETTQSQISRIEARDDHLVSTLRAYVQALGGELEVIARFGDRSIRLKGV